MSPFDTAWGLVKAPLRGTSGKWFDQSVKDGRFEPRQGAGAFADHRGVWSARGEDYDSANLAFHYAIRGDGGWSEKFNRVPLVHYISRQGNYDVPHGAGSDAIRFPGGVDASTTKEVWRGQTFSDWLNNSGLMGTDSGTFNTYEKEQKKAFMEALERWTNDKGGLKHDSL